LKGGAEINFFYLRRRRRESYKTRGVKKSVENPAERRKENSRIKNVRPPKRGLNEKRLKKIGERKEELLGLQTRG